MTNMAWHKRITDEDRGRLIDAFNGDGDYLALADTLDINRSTARSIIATFLGTGRRNKAAKGGPRNVKVDNDIRTEIERLIEDNPLLTLLQIKTELEANLPNKPPLSTSTIARTLDGMLLTLKLAEDVPIPRNHPRVIDLRYDYAVWFMNEAVIGHTVFIDETGYNIWTRRSFGRALRGAPARRIVNGQRGRNCTCTFAISGEVGLVTHSIALASTTRATFEAFLAQVVDDCSRLLTES